MSLPQATVDAFVAALAAVGVPSAKATDLLNDAAIRRPSDTPVQHLSTALDRVRAGL